MQSLRKERLFWWVTVPALVLVLATLAVLQYRWSGQISAATREQMQSNLQTSLMGFRMDLARELGAVAVELRAAAGDSNNVRPADLSEQFRHWQATAQHPGLVEHIYVWKRTPSDRLLELDSSRDQMEAVEWPASFEKMHQHLAEANFVVNRSGMRAHFARPKDHKDHIITGHHTLDGFGSARSKVSREESPPFWMVDEDIPALAYPLLPRPSENQPPAVPDWLIVQVNTGVLAKEVFPELAQKYFRGRSGMDYHVAVLAGKDRVLYSSDGQFNTLGTGSVDDQINLLGSPFRRNSNDGPPGGGLGFIGMMRGPAVARPVAPDDRRATGQERLPHLEPFPYSSEDGYWRVAVKHQRGSLEAAVAGLHRRNLMISYGVLVLLALTMTLVVIASQRTRRLAALQMDFVAGVSHELRTPLAVISSAAENIAHGVVSDQQQVTRYGASILKQARQLRLLVEEVLVFAATQQKRGKYQLNPVNIADVMEAALENTTGMAKAASISIERRIEPGLPPAAGDFGALSQCLQNLITNAIKYGSEGQWIGIRAVSHKVDGVVREIEVTVEDRGIGISAQEIKHIFEPFYRSPAVAGSNVHGTGLGLPLARTVIEAMRGRLTVKSEAGKGSSFTIHLGVMANANLPEPASEAIPAETAGYYS